MSVIVDIIEDVVEDVLDVIGDVADFVVDKIIDPVVDTVSNVIDAALDDPVATIAKIAAVATGNAWAIPLIDGANVAAKGGDVGDILEATAKSYVASKVGAKVGSTAGSYVAQETGSEVAGQILGNAAGSASAAVVLGQDPLEAALKGGVQAGVSAGLGYIEENSGGAYNDLPDAAKNVIAAGLTAALTDQEITPELMANAVLQSQITTETVQKYLDADKSLTDGQLAALTAGIQRTTAAAFTGGNVPAAVMSSVAAYGATSFKEWLDDSKVGDTVNNTIDKLSGDYQKLEAKANEVDANTKAFNDAATKYNEVADELRPRFDERDRLKTEYDRALQIFQGTPTQRNADALNAATKAYNDYATQLDKDYTEKYKPQLDEYKAAADAAEARIPTLKAEYDKLVDNMTSSADRLEEDLKPAYRQIDKAFTEALTGGEGEFKEDEYKQLYNLDDDEDAYYHYLTYGRQQGLPVNQEQYNAELGRTKTDLVNSALESAGIAPTSLSESQLKSIQQYFNRPLEDLKKMGFEDAGADLQNLLINDAKTLIDENTNDPTFFDDLVKEYYGVDSIDDLNSKQKTDLLNQIQSGSKQRNADIKRADGVTEEDIINGKATLSYNKDTGLVEWDNIVFSVPTLQHVDEFGRTLLVQEDRTGDGPGSTFTRKLTDPITGEVLSNETYEFQSYPGDNSSWYVRVGGFNVLDNEGATEGGPTRITIRGASLNRLQEQDPSAFLAQVSNFSKEAGVLLDASVGKPIYDFATNLSNYIMETEQVQDIVNSDTFRNIAGVTTDATGELLQSMNTLVLLAGINPESTPLGKTAKNLLTMAGDLKTDEYKAAAADIQSTIANANLNEDGTIKTNADGSPLSTWAKAWNSVKAIGGAAMDNPGVFASEYIAKEVLQEVPVFIASGGTGNIARRVFMEGGEQFAKDIGRKTALSTAATLDVAESFGGTANGAYQDAYATAIKSGMSVAEAETYAKDIAINAGTIAALTTIGTMGIGGNKFEEAIFNGKKGKSFSEAFDIMAKEAGQETVEEGLPQAFVESQLYQLDPTRDIVGNVVSNSVLGAISGGGTSGSIYSGVATGDVLTNALVMFNPKVRNIYESAANSAEGAQAAASQFADLGITDPTIQTNLLNSIYDQGYTSTAEAFDAAANYASSTVPYQFQASELNQFVGANPDADLNTAIDSYVDPRYFDVDEVIAAAAQEGVTLTPEQAQQYVGQTDEAQGVADVREEYDPLYTMASEVQEFAPSDFGFSDDEINQYVGMSEADAQAAIDQFVDERTITEDEIRQMFADLGYTPTDEEIQRNLATGRRGADIEEGTRQAIANYVGPKLVTEIEARNFFGQLGYQPTDDEVQQFIGQVDEATQKGLIEKYVDPRMVTMEELQAIADIEGLTLDETLAAAYLGQQDEAAALEAAQAAFDPLATTKQEATEFFQALGFTPSEDQINQFVGATSEEEQQAAIAEFVDPLYTDADEAKEFLTSLGYTPTDEEIQQFTGQVAENAQQEAISSYVDPLMVTEQEVIDAFTEAGLPNVRPEDIEALVGQYNQELLAEKLQEALPGAQYNVLSGEISDLSGELSDVQTELGEQITGVEETLGADIDAIAELVGKPAKDVTQVDIDFVADLIAQQEALADPSQFTFTEEQLAYDVTGDGIVDINDQTLLENAIQGQDITFAPESVFAQPATGLYAQQQQTQNLITDLQQNLLQQVEDEAAKAQKVGNIRQLQNMLMQSGDIYGQQVDVKTPDPARIGYLYDFSSIFATPQQAAMFPSPYAEGGVVDATDEILRILGDK